MDANAHLPWRRLRDRNFVKMQNFRTAIIVHAYRAHS